MDFDPVHGIERPNHGLANALRKASLVRPVAQAYRELYKGGALGSFAFSEGELLAMEVALLFEVCGQERCRKQEAFPRQKSPSPAAWLAFRLGWGLLLP